MKRFNILVVFFIALVACKGQTGGTEEKALVSEEVKFVAYGAKILPEKAKSPSEMAAAYAEIGMTDSLQTKFKAQVKEVCKAKGCWMKLILENGEEAMVRFKDYGFFVPTDIEGKEVIVNGLAFINEMAVEEQRHYARDAGASDDEIAQITEPKRTLGFEADGVLLKQ